MLGMLGFSATVGLAGRFTASETHRYANRGLTARRDAKTRGREQAKGVRRGKPRRAGQRGVQKRHVPKSHGKDSEKTRKRAKDSVPGKRLRLVLRGLLRGLGGFFARGDGEGFVNQHARHNRGGGSGGSCEGGADNPVRRALRVPAHARRDGTPGSRGELVGDKRRNRGGTERRNMVRERVRVGLRFACGAENGVVRGRDKTQKMLFVFHAPILRRRAARTRLRRVLVAAVSQR